MSEQDYTNVRDLSNVIHANDILTQICIANQPAIPAEEFKDVLNKVWSWREKLFEVVQK